MELKKELKHIRGLAKVLNTLANEVEGRGKFTDKDKELLKNLGSSLLFKGVTLGYSEPTKNGCPDCGGITQHHSKCPNQ